MLQDQLDEDVFMDDREFRKQVNRIKQFHPRWISVMGFEEWDITFLYSRDGSGMAERELEKGIAEYELLTINVVWEYRMALVKVNVPMLKEYGDVELENRYVHELSHALIRAWQKHSSPSVSWASMRASGQHRPQRKEKAMARSKHAAARRLRQENELDYDLNASNDLMQAKKIRLKQDITIPKGTVIDLGAHTKTINRPFFDHVMGVGPDNTMYLIVFPENDKATHDMFEPVTD